MGVVVVGSQAPENVAKARANFSTGSASMPCKIRRLVLTPRCPLRERARSTSTPPVADFRRCSLRCEPRFHSSALMRRLSSILPYTPRDQLFKFTRSGLDLTQFKGGDLQALKFEALPVAQYHFTFSRARTQSAGARKRNNVAGELCPADT